MIAAVAASELRSGLRDRRSMVSALLFPLFGPILMAVMFGVIVAEQSDERPVELPVVGADNAPALVEHLERQGIAILPAPQHARKGVASGELDVVLEIPPEFRAQFRSGRPAELRLYVDTSRRESHKPIDRVNAALQAYSGKLGTLRLMARGVDPKLAQPFAIEQVDTATPQRHALNLLVMIPMFVMLAAFVSGMFIATDSTAGERERRSMEPLLVSPASRWALVLGKWLATATFASVGLTLTLVVSVISMSQVPLDKIGFAVDLGLGDLVVILLTLLPMAILASALQLFVASFAKSSREAQTYLSLLTFAPTVPALISSLKPMSPELWMAFVPALGQQTLLLGLLRGEPQGPLAFGISAAVAVVLALGLLAATVRLFGSERMVA